MLKCLLKSIKVILPFEAMHLTSACALRNFCGKLKPVSGLQNVSIVESMGWQQLVDLCITKFQNSPTDVTVLYEKTLL